MGSQKFVVNFSLDSLIIFGNEREGIPRKISRGEGVEKFVVPVVSNEECLSLSIAYGIVVYEFLRQNNLLPKIH